MFYVFRCSLEWRSVQEREDRFGEREVGLMVLVERRWLTKEYTLVNGRWQRQVAGV
jgi:hypothetical protein